MDELDVLVVGGGPAGLAVAESAACAGRVRVVHKDAEIGHPVRTSGGSWLTCIQKLEIPPALYREASTLRFVGPATEVTVEFGKDRLVVLDVAGTYQYLAERARRTGATVQTGTKFTGILEHAAEGVVCQLESAQGTQLVRARFVVDASGHARAVWRAAGLAERPARVGIGAEIECQEASGADGRCVLFVGSAYAPSGYGWIFPAPGGRVRVGVGVQRPDSAASPADLLQHFLGSPEVRRLGLCLGEPVERHFGVIPADGVPPAFACGRLVGVGDAVGQALPLVGEGIRYAIEAGRHLGRGLALALTGAQSHAQVFRAYEAWWKGRYGRPFALAQRLNERMARFSDREWDDALPLLGRFAPDDVARLLRVEIGGRLALRILRLGGWRAARLGVRHWWSGRAATSRDSAGAA